MINKAPKPNDITVMALRCINSCDETLVGIKSLKVNLRGISVEVDNAEL
jgi:hypothetical protein